METNTLLDRNIVVNFLERGGKWQKIQSALLYLNYVMNAFQVLIIVFIGFTPNFKCVDFEAGIFNASSNGTGFTNECTVFNATSNTTFGCVQGFVYDVRREESIVSEWDLVCSKAYLAETSQVLYTVGLAVGSFFAPSIADRFGRRKPYLSMRAVGILTSFGLAWAPSIVWFMVIRTMDGAFHMACVVIGFVYLVELSPASKRPLVIVVMGLVWAITLCIQALVAYLMRGYNWRHLQVALCVPALTFVLEIIFIKESLMWLFTNNRREEAVALLERAIRMNTKSDKTSTVAQHVLDLQPLPEDSHVDILSQHDAKRREKETFVVSGERKEEEDKNFKKLTVCDVIKSGKMRVLLAITCLAWFTSSLVYYGIYLMSDSLTGDRILNFFLGAVVEIPANIVLYFILTHLGRRKPLVGLHALCAISLLLASIFTVTLEGQAKTILIRIVTFIGKFGITTTFNIIYVYSTEVFPTNFRASGFGLGSASARIGSFLSPFANVLNRELPWGPGVVFGGLCLILTFALLFVPETHDRHLPQSIAEIEKWTEVKDGSSESSSSKELNSSSKADDKSHSLSQC